MSCEAFAIFDERIAAIARQFEDFKQAEAVGAIHSANSIQDLAARLALPADALTQTLRDISEGGTDRFGRTFSSPPLTPPYKGVRVTGALFHTQGGLKIDASARVLRANGAAIQNLYAGGGAACGVSGSAIDSAASV